MDSITRSQLAELIDSLSDVQELEAVSIMIRNRHITLELRQAGLFSVGDRVKFQGTARFPGLRTGTVSNVRRGASKVRVMDDGGVEWTVSPSLLSFVG